jgi:hypothetical protein
LRDTGCLLLNYFATAQKKIAKNALLFDCIGTVLQVCEDRIVKSFARRNGFAAADSGNLLGGDT